MVNLTLEKLQRTVTVEPVFLLFSLANHLRSIIFQTLLYDKVCALTFNATVCANIQNGNYSEEEAIVQKATSEWEFYDHLALTLPSIFVNLFYGGISDKISRKLPMILSPIGGIFHTLILLILSLNSEAAIAWILVGTLFSALTGGMITIVTCALSYLSAVTTVKNRTWRISIAEAMMLLSGAIAQFVSGDLLRVTSFVFVFSFVIVLNVIVILYVVLWLKNADIGIANNEDETQQNHCKTVCNPSYVTESIAVTFKKREHGRREFVIVQVAIIGFFVLAISPAWTLGYLFLRHAPLSWTPTTYGHFTGLAGFLRAICLLVVLPLLKKFARLSDTALMIIGSLSGMFSLLLFGFSTVSWMVYLVPVLGFFGPVTIISIRGLISTLVEKDELGKIFGVVASLEAFSFLLASCLYNYVLYPNTVDSFPGASFVVGAAVMLIPVALASWLHVSIKKQKYNTLEEDINGPDFPDQTYGKNEEELSAVA